MFQISHLEFNVPVQMPVPGNLKISMRKCFSVKQSYCDNVLLHWILIIFFVYVQEEYDKYLQIPTEKCKLVGIFEKAMLRNLHKYEASSYCVWDQAAMAAAINDSVVTETKEVYCLVEISNGITRGQVVVDWQNRNKKSPNVRLMVDLDKSLYDRLIYQGVGG